ncbi:MAG TPA: nucleoside-diphosphate kinase [Treponemataceae bacterium]|jgi:nucleoside-diphosphate kinase|nr:nucleoside-diphosphate kinase [Spirochaetaceae bacterium]HOE07827.1 nucleoside-diphosphate kinase [Treponemataceae bacterium]HPX25846.1 nucleoside-diphosphate kinase [Treponemataceae bacterium]HQL05047.1 nucleoside-diphosphate kinase [Treponemataceae bacterium]
MERCFVMLKPGTVNRRIAGEVISRLERKGLRLVGVKMLNMSLELAKTHYAEHEGRPFYDTLIQYITSGPVIAMVWQSDDCVTLVRKLTGSTIVTEASPGTIRGDYCCHTPHNIIHASDSKESAEREISLFFKPEELCVWKDEPGCRY